MADSVPESLVAYDANAIPALQAAGLCCPRCKGELVDHTHPPDASGDGGELRCEPCAESFPVICGIPDLRIAPDPYIGIEADRAKGRRLAAVGAREWQQLAAHYYDITLDTVPPKQARLFASGLHAAEPRAAAALDAWERLAGRSLQSTDRLLDIGCGTAPLLAAAGRRDLTRQGALIGIDVAFRWLVVGKLRLANAGVRAHLVCACAEALPFREQTFDVCTAQATLENVRDQDDALSEMARVLARSGHAWIATANRLSLGPDPHLGIPAGGYLSETAAAAWARRRGALPPQRRLLSRRELSGLLQRHGFERALFGTPAIPAAQRQAAGPLLGLAAGGYELVRRTPLLREALLQIGPTLLATATTRPTRDE